MLHLPADLGPGNASFHFSDANQQQRQPAQQHMGADAIVFGVIYGP